MRRTSAVDQFRAEAGQTASRAPDCATDLDYLVSLGYPHHSVREALSTTRGDRSSALHLLQKGCAQEGKDVRSWRGELKDDFTAGAATTNLPTSVDNRALWKTPYYVRVGEPRTRNAKTFYTLSVVKKNGESWKIERSYSEFLSLKNSLPLFTTSNFKNPFPPKKDFIALFSTVNTEQRRQALEEWMRELCLDETCMRNDTIVHLLEEFVSATPGIAGAGVGVPSLSSPTSSSSSSSSSSSTSVLLPSTPAGGMMRYGGTAPSTALSSPVPGPNYNIATLQMLSGPITYQQLKTSLPCKIPLLEAPPAPQPNNHSNIDAETARLSGLKFYSNDASSAPSIEPMAPESIPADAVPLLGPAGLDHASLAMKQLQKDYSRDRVILQGTQRLEGSSTEIASIVTSMQAAVSAILEKAAKPPLIFAFSASFFVSILTAMSRTESAYLAHASLSNVLCSSGSVSDGDGDEGHTIVVPESSLADPIKINFRVKDREGSVGAGDWCVVCECEASTVFRLNDAEADDLATLCQVKTTVMKTIFGMPRVTTEGRGEVLNFMEKPGKSVLVLEREMRSTARDWGAGNPF